MLFYSAVPLLTKKHTVTYFCDETCTICLVDLMSGKKEKAKLWWKPEEKKYRSKFTIYSMEPYFLFLKNLKLECFLVEEKKLLL